jgi:hypothetical protein
VASSHPDRTGAQAVDLSGGIVSFGAVVDAATDVDLYLLTRKLLLLQKGFWFCVNPSGRICMLRRLLSISLRLCAAFESSELCCFHFLDV